VMRSKFEFKMKYLAQLMLSGALISAAGISFAQDVIDVGTVQNSAATTQDSATYQAPTQSSLIATQPQSVINQHYIQENAAPSANYSDIANIAPSVQSIDPNGPGLMETQGLSMRGFQNGEYNVTFDGIPWGDSNDFTQHSTSYFMAQDTGSIVVDRGPGDASNIGNATFGGTIAATSKDINPVAGVTPYASFGSFNTKLFGVEMDTGVMQNTGDASAFIDYKNLTSDGYLTYAGQRRQNLFFKYAKPLSDNTVLTFVTMQNKLHQNVALGTTLANMQLYGKNFGLNNDPTSQAYYGYNYDNITADFEYLGMKSRQGDLSVDNKIYTYAYYHDGFNGADPGLGLPNGTFAGLYPNNVPGQKMNMNYRSTGDILRMAKEIGTDKLDFGAWVDYQTNNRMQMEVDFTSGALDTTAGTVGAIDRLMTDSLTTIQPYVQYEWKASDALTLTPGLKYVSFNRKIDAIVNQGAGGSLNTSQTWTKALPALTAHYKIQPNWTAYAQFAKGMLAPNLNSFYPKTSTGPNLVSTLSPEQTTNYQLGTTWVGNSLTVSGDVYSVDFSNKITSSPCGLNTCFSNGGGVKYNGIEGEATYVVGAGYSLYGNYAINNYTKSDGGNIQNAPKSTAAAGVIYNQGPAYASLIAKQVGTRYSGVDTAGNDIPMSSYTVVNFATSYEFKNSAASGKSTKVGFQVSNLFNNNSVYASFANDANNNPMFYALPTRSYMVNLSIDL
jgi:iron complex outermembrane receptor protein